MINDSAAKPASALTDDQRAVADYFASDAYKEVRLSSPADRTFDQIPIIVTLFVFSCLLAVCGVWMACVIKLLGTGTGPPAMPVMMLIVGFGFCPAPIVFSFCVAIATLWRGSVWLRVLMGMVMTVPAALAYYAAMDVAIGNLDSNFYLYTSAALFGQFVGGGGTAILFQMFSRYTLTESSSTELSTLKPTNLRSFFELTIFFAIAFVIASAFDGDQLPIVTFSAAVWGFAATLGVIRLLITFLQIAPASKLGLIAAAVACYLPSFAITGLFAFGAQGWQLSLQNFAWVAVHSIICFASVVIVVAACVTLLRRCGWMLVDERTWRLPVA